MTPFLGCWISVPGMLSFLGRASGMVRSSKTGQFDYGAERAYYADPPEGVRDFLWLEGHFKGLASDYPVFFDRKRILDIGAGECLHGMFICTRCSPELYVNLDLFADRMRAAHRRAHPKCLAFVVGDGFALPFADAIFDVVFVSGVLFRLRPLECVVEEIARVLVPSGVFLGIEANFLSPLVILRRALMRRKNANDSRLLPGVIRDVFVKQGLSCETGFFWRRFPSLASSPLLGRMLCPTVRVLARKPVEAQS